MTDDGRQMDNIDQTFEALRKSPWHVMQREVLEAGRGKYGMPGGYMAIINERNLEIVEWAPGAEKIIEKHGWTLEEVHQKLITTN